MKTDHNAERRMLSIKLLIVFAMNIFSKYVYYLYLPKCFSNDHMRTVNNYVLF